MSIYDEDPEAEKRRAAKIKALLDAPTMATKNQRAGIKKQNVKESFVYKVLNGQEQLHKLPEYMDLWTPESMMQLHDFLGFDEREWLMIMADSRAAAFIVQERAFRLGRIAVDRFNYQKVLEEIAQKDADIETVVKSAIDPTGAMNRMVQLGGMSRVPHHLMVAYKAYGWMQHKLFIDLEDFNTLTFDWLAYEAAKASVQVVKEEARKLTVAPIVEAKAVEPQIIDVPAGAPQVPPEGFRWASDEERKAVETATGTPHEGMLVPNGFEVGPTGMLKKKS